MHVLHERPSTIYDRFERKAGDSTVTHYCPGCGHGNVHKYVAEAIEDFGLQDRTVFVNPVGCSVFAYYYLDVGHVQAPHGRAPAVATAIKRALPDRLVLCYQGDGDLAAIGGNEILQAANRGENITVLFVNNALYGMTGGQMAPTSLLGQKTTTSPAGRSSDQEGYPMRVAELLAALRAPAYIERVALGSAKHDMAARKAIRRAIRNQVDGLGFSFVEILSPCPTGWKLEPPAAARFVLETMTKTYPLGVTRERSADRPPAPVGLRRPVDISEIPKVLGLAGGAPEASALPASLHAGEAASSFANPRIKAAGFGGQGVLFLGSLIAEAGMLAGRAVSWLPSYGPEMRGGTAHCHVILSEEAVDSPLVTRATVLFAFNRPSLERFLPEVVPGGLVVYDSSLLPDPPDMPGVETLGIPASSIAETLGAPRAANMVALGAWVARSGALPAEAIETALRRHFKPETVALNMMAFEAGARIHTRAASAGEVARGAPAGAPAGL